MFDEINRLHLFDFWIDSLGVVTGDVLELHASNSAYSAAAKVRFIDVEFVCIATMFHHAVFREATSTESLKVRALADFRSRLFAIDSDSGETPFFVAAASAQVTIA